MDYWVETVLRASRCTVLVTTSGHVVTAFRCHVLCLKFIWSNNSAHMYVSDHGCLCICFCMWLGKDLNTALYLIRSSHGGAVSCGLGSPTCRSYIVQRNCASKCNNCTFFSLELWNLAHTLILHTTKFVAMEPFIQKSLISKWPPFFHWTWCVYLIRAGPLYLSPWVPVSLGIDQRIDALIHRTTISELSESQNDSGKFW